MSNTILQVKRSATTAIPGSLSNGELAYSGNGVSNSLFIGHPDGSTGVIRIAGGKYPYLHQAGSPGVVTANAVVILDANGYTANVRSSGLFVSTSISSPVANATAALITSISPQYTPGQLGANVDGSNTELATTWAIKSYVDNKTSAGSTNTAAAYTWTNVNSFSANVNIAGNTSALLNIGTTVAANLSANATTLLFNANTAANGSINATAYSGTANNANNLGGTSLATLQNQITGNAASAYSNATSYADTVAGNAYANAVANAAALYQTTAGLSANVATLTANAAGYLANSSGTLTNILNYITGNAATAYSNGTSYADAKAGNAYSNATSYVTAGGYTITGAVNYSGNVNITGNTTSVLNIGTINATSIGLLANSTVLTVGNSSVNTTVNATSFSGTANNANNLGGTSLTTLQTQITGNAATAYSNATTYSSNASNISTGTLGYAYLPANVVIRSNTNTFTAVQTFNANVAIVGNTTGVLAIGSGSANLVANAVAITLSANTTDILTINTTAIQTGNSTVYSTVSQTLVNTSSLSVGGQVSVNATVASFGTVANISAPSASLTVSSITAGNLNVTGTLTTIDTQTLQVKDNFVLVADGNANVAADAVDFGIYGVANTASVTTYYGLGRVASGNYFQLFSTTTSPSNTTIAGTSTSTLQAYLQPFGAGGAFVVNASAMALTANSTVSLSLAANTLSLSTALPTTSGGTGYGSYTAGDILYASNTSYLSKLTLGADGTVLQVQGTTLAWASLDGGTF